MFFNIKRWKKTSSNSLHSIKEMSLLAWQAQPTIFTTLILLQFIQGMVPVITAWVTKEIFDLLASAMQNGASYNFVRDFLPLLMIQLIVALCSVMVEQVNQYFVAELGRKLYLSTQYEIYNRLNTFKGLNYFEMPHFHDTMRIASEGAFKGPSQILNIMTAGLRASITIVTFLSILLLLSPILVFFTLLASFPQLLIQLRIGKERYELVSHNSPMERKAGYFGQILSSLRFAKEIRVFNLGDYFLKQFITISKDVQSNQRQQQLRELRWQAFTGTLSTLMSSVALVLVFIYAFQGEITIGDVTLYTNAFGAILGAISIIIFSVGSLNENVLFFEQYTKLMSLPSDLQQIADPRQITDINTGIELKNVSFRYGENGMCQGH